MPEGSRAEKFIQHLSFSDRPSHREIIKLVDQDRTDAYLLSLTCLGRLLEVAKWSQARFDHDVRGRWQDEKLHIEKVEVVEIAVEEEVSEAPVVAKAITRPGNSDKTRRRHRKDTTYFQAAADAPEVPVVPEKFKGMTTYFKVDADAPPVPAIPAKYPKKSVPVSTSRTDIAFPSIKTEFTAALTPVKKSAPVLTFSLFALTEDEDEEEDSEELVHEEETVTIKYKEVVRHSPVQTLIRGWEAQEGEAKARRMASGVWWK